MKTHAMVAMNAGAPDVLRWKEVELASPGRGEVRIRHTAIGLNFVDTYYRSGLYPTTFPGVLGSEAAGIIEEVFDETLGFVKGDRVAYATGPLGAYAEQRIASAAHLVKVPAGVDDTTAAAVMLKGMTAEYLVRRTYAVKAGDTIVVHAAAGGVGLLLSQWAKHLGATVIGTVGSEAKAELARAHGCDHVVFYRTEDPPARVKALTGGEGAAVVYDSVGRDTFAASLACLRRRGLLVTFGQSSGPIPPFDPRVLSQHGSLYVTRPTLGDYVATRAELDETARALFDVVISGAVRVKVAQRYALRDAERAHADLEARKTTGSTLLLP
jgi:NADPH2:quinone reductase